MEIIWEWIDYWIKWTRENEVTTRLFTMLREKYPKAFVWKIPDIGNKLKPCDWIRIMPWPKVYIIEAKMIKEKVRDNYQEMFIKKMEPLQILTFHKLTQLGIDCVMLWYHIHTHTFYSIIYKHDWWKETGSAGGASTTNRSYA